MKYKKAVSVTIMLIMYFAVLTAVSYLRSPGVYIVEDGSSSLVNYKDFFVQSGNGSVYVAKDALVFQSGDNEAKTFAAALQLQDLQRIKVLFSVDCSENNAGTNLHVDLCTDGYDTNEQETVINLQLGLNQIDVILDKGENAPESAYLRFFTLAPANYQVKDLLVLAMTKKNNKTVLWVSGIVFFLAFIVLFSISVFARDKKS